MSATVVPSVDSRVQPELDRFVQGMVGAYSKVCRDWLRSS